MLLMPALQLRDPILPFVQMKPNNLPPNPNRLFFHVFPGPFIALYSMKPEWPSRWPHGY